MSIQLLLEKLQELEPWEEWQQSSFSTRAIHARYGRVIVYTLGAWCYNNGCEQHIFGDLYSFMKMQSVLGKLKAL